MELLDLQFLFLGYNKTSRLCVINTFITKNVFRKKGSLPPIFHYEEKVKIFIYLDQEAFKRHTDGSSVFDTRTYPFLYASPSGSPADSLLPSTKGV